jgi:hypothetical protein
VGADEVVEVDVGVTRHEHAEDTLEARPPQLDANVGMATELALAVYVGQNAETFADSWSICRKQLSWLHFEVGVALTNVVGVAVVSFL